MCGGSFCLRRGSPARLPDRISIGLLGVRPGAVGAEESCPWPGSSLVATDGFGFSYRFQPGRRQKRRLPKGLGSGFSDASGVRRRLGRGLLPYEA